MSTILLAVAFGCSVASTVIAFPLIADLLGLTKSGKADKARIKELKARQHKLIMEMTLIAEGRQAEMTDNPPNFQR